MSAPVRAAVGTRPPPRTVGPVSQTDVVRFAGAGGDFNPLHHDPEAATAAGFDRPIVMGQMTAGLLAAWLTDWCGVEHLRELSVRFTAPLRLGDVVEIAGEVAAVDDELAVLDLSVVRQGTAVLTGSATVTVRPG